MKTLTQADRRKIVRKAYKPYARREYTDREVDQEIENLKRHAENGTLDDFSLRLYCQLDLEPNRGRY